MRVTERQRAFNIFIEHALLELSRGFPEFPTHMGLFEVAGEQIPQNQFSSLGDAAADTRQHTLQRLAATLTKFPRDALQPGQQISAEVLDFFCDFAHERGWIGLKGRDFLRHEYLLRPSAGLQSDLPLFLSDLHPMRHEQDAADYLQRLQLIAPMLAEAGELVVERQSDGILPPRFLIEDTIAEIHAFVATAPDENILYHAFAGKSGNLPGLSADQRTRMLENIGREIRDRTYPAYMQLAETLSLQLGDAHDEPGVWHLPNGESYYDFLLQSATTTSLSAREIHQLGRVETDKLEVEFIDACHDLGYNADSIEECHRLLNQDRKSTSSGAATTRKAIIDHIDSLLENIWDHLPGLFNRLPRSKLIIKPIPKFAESSRGHNYQPPSLDGSRPGVFEINIGQLLADRESADDIPTLVYHETLPGHHLQLALALESEDLPKIRRMITFDAFIEGWAKYSESIPWTHGINTDPRWRVARLRSELISTVNLVMDTGIHVQRWSVEKAVGYLRQHTGITPAYATHLVRRSAADPAQMCSYKIGMLKMLELKNRMSKALAPSFDIRNFHDVVLRNGAVPLKSLDGIVDREIAALAHRVEPSNVNPGAC